MDNVNKPHNLSAILRSCDAVGIETVHAVAVDKLIRNRQSAAKGSDKWITLRTHANTGEALGFLRKSGMQILVAHHGEASADFRTVDYTKPTAIVMGAELHGPSETAISTADRLVHIPMQGMVESLNVSVAAAVILFEAQRQRMTAGMYETPRFSDEYLKRRLFELAYPLVSKKLSAQGIAYPELDDEGRITGHD